jgi:hypothetical protein
MRMSEEYKETPEQQLARDVAERAAKAAIFLREHQLQARAFEITGPGIPGPAGPGPTQSQDTPGADNGDRLKA